MQLPSLEKLFSVSAKGPTYPDKLSANQWSSCRPKNKRYTIWSLAISSYQARRFYAVQWTRQDFVHSMMGGLSSRAPPLWQTMMSIRVDLFIPSGLTCLSLCAAHWGAVDGNHQIHMHMWLFPGKRIVSRQKDEPLVGHHQQEFMHSYSVLGNALGLAILIMSWTCCRRRPSNLDADPGLNDFIANNSWGTKQDMNRCTPVLGSIRVLWPEAQHMTFHPDSHMSLEMQECSWHHRHPINRSPFGCKFYLNHLLAITPFTSALEWLEKWVWFSLDTIWRSSRIKGV